MSQRGNGYNNPAFCNQFDNSLYDYEYVPEIDPDSPVFERKSSYRPPKQVPPWNANIGNNGEQFDNSDESNRSIIIEERNNRRVTMICEKRGAVEEEVGCYAHDISLESNADEEDNQLGFLPVEPERTLRERNLQQKLHSDYRRSEHVPAPIRDNFKRHRYEELEEIKIKNEVAMGVRPIHRYAEIDDDFEAEGVRFHARKPRAPSPIENYHSISPSRGSNGFNFRRTPSPITYPIPNYKDSPRRSQFDDGFLSQHPYTSSPIQSPNVFELSDFSPPRRFEREPPIGASASHDPEQSYKNKISRKPSTKFPNNIEHSEIQSPSKRQEKRNLLSTPKLSPKIIKARTDESTKRPLVRRNISSSFYNDCSSPYRPTTQTVNNRNTAVITPIFQRKFAELTNEKMSRLFQSTGDVLKVEPNGHNRHRYDCPVKNGEGMKRNKSVPNFQHHLAVQKRTPIKLRPENRGPVSVVSNGQRTEMHSSPAKSPDRFSPLNRSRMSLLDNLKASWSYLGTDSSVPSSGCLALAAALQLAAGMVSCAICFYLLSRLGRRYYLDLGMLSGFLSIVLGALGFRSQYWKWLPHRNYVTGYFVLTIFSLITCGSLLLIITVRPMAGDPIMDVTAGAICTVSVIIILISLTGLTMSGCCKAPPPDNRVTCA